MTATMTATITTDINNTNHEEIRANAIYWKDLLLKNKP